MSQNRDRQPFEQDDFVLAGDEKQQTPLQGKQVFDEQSIDFDISENELMADDHAEHLVERTPRWLVGLLVLLVSFMALNGYQLYQAISERLWSAIFWQGFGLSVSIVLFIAVSRVLLRWRVWQQHQDWQRQAEQLRQQAGLGNALPLCQRLSQLSPQYQDGDHYQVFVSQVSSHHNDRDVLNLFEQTVLAPLDHKASQLIAKYAADSAALVAISPFASADMLLVAWRNVVMIDKLSALYGVRLGQLSRWRLLKHIAMNMASAGASEWMIDNGFDALSVSASAKLSARASQGIGIGLLTARVGIQAVSLTRPIKANEQRVLTLKKIRQAVLSHVIRLYRGSKTPDNA
ncbi:MULTISPECIES: TIGR01620 family protein [unclassified Vibrio]|uniref:TIGR01620 family protein n=1 Tax=Vibrio sp. HB236076 TaxID=3232307 RepID=A0AB39HB31_9VIBR|nr:TIGR01620 family protein [Vibrio sp. HB161653]MDP5253497.1 TIGR01620 family protein [Vibrio sp. HB161653]